MLLVRRRPFDWQFESGRHEAVLLHHLQFQILKLIVLERGAGGLVVGSVVAVSRRRCRASSLLLLLCGRLLRVDLLDQSQSVLGRDVLDFRRVTVATAARWRNRRRERLKLLPRS